MNNSNFEFRISNWLIPLLRAPWTGEAGRFDADAEPLVQYAIAQGVGPLLYSRARGQDLLAPEAEELLRQAYYATAARGMRLQHELEALLRALAAAQIPVLLLKGAALARAVYDNPALRPMGDIDLLVHPADVEAALAALAGLGYRFCQHEPARDSIRTYNNEIMVRREGGPAPVELHWGLFDSPHHQHHLPLDWFWETAVAIPPRSSPDGGRAGDAAADGADRAVPTSPRMFGPAAQLLHLCAHLVLHHSNDAPRLLWLHDVAEVLVRCQAEVDWSALLSQARVCDLVVPLQRVLPRIARDWRAPVPPAVLDELGRLTPAHAEQRIVARLAGHRPAGRLLWDTLADTPSWRQRLGRAWINVFPTPAYMRQRYGIRHPLLIPFYYPYRWFLGLRGLFGR